MYDSSTRIEAREEVFDTILFNGGAYVIRRPVGGVGDAVMINNAITGLRNEAGEDELIVVVCIDYVASIFAANKAVDYIISFNAEEVQQGLEKAAIRRLRDCNCVVYDYYEPCPAAEYESDNSPYILTKLFKTVCTEKHITKSRQQIFCDHIGVAFDVDNYNMYIDGEYDELVQNLGKDGRYVVVQLRSHDKWRNYPPWKTKWLLRELVKLGNKNDFGVVTLDSTQASTVKGVVSMRGTVLDLAMAVIKQSLVGIGPDSMLVHIKGAFGGHCLGLFGPTDPLMRLEYEHAHWLPPFTRCRRQPCWYTPCRFRPCLAAVPSNPGVIIDMVQTILS